MQLLFLLILKVISHVNTQINIVKAVAKPTIVLYLVMMMIMALLLWSASSADGFYNIRMGADWRTTTCCFDITHILSKPLLCSKFTDRKGITDTATMNFVVTNDRKRRNLGWNNRRFWSRNIIIRELCLKGKSSSRFHSQIIIIAIISS